jgi:imidazoleglycerol-phosphate dehydratase
MVQVIIIFKTGFKLFRPSLRAIFKTWLYRFKFNPCLVNLEIDEHHTIEDIAIALGTAINNALGDRIGIARICFK